MRAIFISTTIIQFFHLFCLVLVEGISSTTHVIYDSSNHLHRDMQYHPEQAARIDVCVDALASFTSADQCNVELRNVCPDSKDHFSEESLIYAKQILKEIHSPELVDSLEAKCRSSRQRRIGEGKDSLGFIGHIDEGDTFLTTESYDVCLRATAAWIECVNRVLNDLCTYSFALTRPPGHHATSSLPNGFCLFNFAAAAAVHVSKHDKCKKITIVDWDVHYGQGTADIIQNYENIRYVSTHQVPAFPYCGEKRGIRGQYKNLMTVPIQPESSWHCGFRELFTEKVLPFCSSPDWKPDLVIVSAGYDALDSDDLASCSLQAKDYNTMTKMLRQHVGDEVKIMFGLEGGYQLQPGKAGGNLQDAFIETIKALQL